MTTTQVVKTSVTVNNNSPIQDYVHLDDQTQFTFDKQHSRSLAVLENAKINKKYKALNLP